MRFCVYIFVINYVFTLLGYSVIELAHEISHRYAAYIHIHSHHHNHHHSIKDHPHVAQLLGHHEDENPGKEDFWINLFSYYQSTEAFHFKRSIIDILKDNERLIFHHYTITPPTPPPCNFSFRV